MEAGVILLLLFAVLGGCSTQSFYGDSISFMPLQKKADGRFKVTYYHRQNGRSDCYNQSSFTCEGGACTDLVQSDVVQTDQDDSGQGRWCQSEGRTTVWVQPNGTTFTLRDSGCCWVSNVEGTTSWMSGAELDLGTRSDSHNLNNCPVTTTVSSLRIPQNCFTRVHLLAHDPDGDAVTCRFAPGATVPSGFTLDQTTCTLRNTGDVQTGVHVMELVLEDFPTSNISLSYADGTSATRGASDTDSPPLCEVQLQFSVEVLPPISTCVVGNLLPMFLSRTPSHGEVLYATLGQTFQLYAQAQAQNSQIQTFQVSGPENMTKEFSTGSSGKAEVTLSWTPQQEDLRRLVPVCFTAETAETQSEMRCVVVMVTRATISQGIVTVSCSSNKMTVALDKASMPDIDEHYLNLRDPSCSLVSNDTYITGTMSFSTCGTTLEDKGDYIVFSNEIHSFERPTEVITRRKKVQIDFSCEFPKTISISSYYNVHPSDYIFTESSFGSFGYSFGIFLDGNFTNSVPANAYPVQVNLLDMIYMGIQADADLPNVTLFVESCKATPDDNPENSLSYYLIQNGCLEDETVKVHPSNQTSFFFEVEAFKFNGDFNQVYITCVVILCEAGNPFSRCSQGCLSNPSRRRRRGLSKETTRHYITQGPLQFVESSPSSPLEEERLALEPRIDSEGQNMNEPTGSEPGISPAVIPGTRSGEYSWGIKKALTSNITVMVLSAGFIILLILLAVIIHRLGQRRKAEDCDVLIDPDFESEPN